MLSHCETTEDGNVMYTNDDHNLLTTFAAFPWSFVPLLHVSTFNESLTLRY